MTLNRFIDKYINTYILYDDGILFKDGEYIEDDNIQSYNLAVKYMWDLNWLPAGQFPYCGRTQGVRDFIEDYDNIPMFADNGVIKINKSSDPNNIPQSGDVVIWGYGVYGHVAVIIEANVNEMKTFEQNCQVSSLGKDNFCKIKNTDYKDVIGWLRKIK